MLGKYFILCCSSALYLLFYFETGLNLNPSGNFTYSLAQACPQPVVFLPQPPK